VKEKENKLTVPAYHELTRPLLELLADGKTYNLPEAANLIACKFNLSEADLAETIPSGQVKFTNRLAWSKYDLNKAGLAETIRRGVFRITDFGRTQLSSLPSIVDRPFLTRQGWITPEHGGIVTDTSEVATIDSGKETPDERIDNAYVELENALAEELLECLKKLEPSSFEKFVVELLKAMNYGIGEVTGRTGDGGIDGVIYEDRLRLDRIYLQAKRWTDASVCAPDIQGFIGALSLKGANNRGVFVTTSHYTQDAKDAITHSPHLRVKLIDGFELSRLAIEYNVGVSTKRKLEIKRLDSDYFNEI
jgi:restriction system protein